MAVPIGVGGLKIRRLVTIRRKPASTTSDNANGADEAVSAQPVGVSLVLRPVLAMWVDEDVDIREQQWLPPLPVALQILGLEERRSLVEVVFREPAASAEGDQLERLFGDLHGGRRVVSL